jgi:hypothetical protein
MQSAGASLSRIPRKTQSDFIFRDHGSLCILTPLTPAGKEWFEANLPVNNPEAQFWCGGICIERRYVADILDGLQKDGLSVAI